MTDISNKIKKLSSQYRQKYCIRERENSNCVLHVANQVALVPHLQADAIEKSRLRKGRDLFWYHDWPRSQRLLRVILNCVELMIIKVTKGVDIENESIENNVCHPTRNLREILEISVKSVRYLYHRNSPQDQISFILKLKVIYIEQ